VSKKPATILLSVTSPNVDKFSKSFTCSLSSKSAIKSSLNIPPHRNSVTTLLCEMFMFRNCSFLLKNRLSKLLASVLCCCYNSCYPPYVRCQASSSSFNRTVPWHTER